MSKPIPRSCLRCCETALEKSGGIYRCRTCGFVERDRHGGDAVDTYQDRLERTLDLVEIFNLGARQRMRGHE